MSKPLNVLISGSGIAGSAFASCLLRAYRNANITIVERDPALRLTGASVDIRSSAVDIIKWMGVEGEIRRNTTNEEGVQLVKENGTPVATFRATGRTDVQSITSEFEIHRGALANIIISPVRDRVRLVFNETVSKYEQHDDGVTVTFANGKEAQKYDLLVAADGLGSKIRGQMLNAKPRDQIKDEGVHAAYFTIKSADLLRGSRLAQGLTAPGGRSIFLRPDPHPDGHCRPILMAVTSVSDNPRKDRLNKALSEGNESYMNLMDEWYRDVGWLAPEILKGMRESDDFYASFFGQVRSPKYQSGRVVLLGDAGYATPGIGTSLAIMGGYVLAGELLDHGLDDITGATKAYEELMMPFVKHQQGSGPDSAMQFFNPQTSWGISVRNTVLGVVSGLRLDRIAMTAGAWLGFTEKKLPMPEYPWPAQASESREMQ